MIALVLAMLRARRGQAWTVGLLALFATASAIAGPTYLRAVDRAVVNHEVAAASPDELSLTVSAYLDSDQTGFTDALYSLTTVPGFSTVYAENYAVLGLLAGEHDESQLYYRQGACDHLVITSGRCFAGAGEIVIGEQTARSRGLAAGSVLTLTYAEVTDPQHPVFNPVGRPTRVTVVGTYHPREPGELYWGGHGYFALDAEGVAAEPVFGSQYTVEHLDHRRQQSAIDSFAAPGTFAPDRLDTIEAQVDGVTNGLSELFGDVQYSTGIPDLIDRIRAGQKLAHQVVPVAAVPLVLLAWFVIFLAVGYGAEARRFELGLLALRGTRLPSRWWLAVGENVIPIVLGAAGGFVVGQLAVAALARARLGPGAAGAIGLAGWQYAVVAGAGAVLCALLAQRRGLSTPVASLLRRVVRPAPAWQQVALEALVGILAVVAVVQLRSSGGVLTGVALLVPGLVILAIALLAGRAVVPLAAWYGRRALGRGRTGTGLAALQLARRPGAQRLLVLLTVAVALLSYAATATDVAATARANEAQVSLGARRVLTLDTVTRLQLLQAVRAIDPQGKFAMAVVPLEEGGPDEPPKLAVDSSRLATVAQWRGDFGPLSAGQVAQRLHPQDPQAVVLTGSTLALDATASGFDTRAGLHLVLTLASLSGAGTIDVDLGTLLAGEHTYPGSIPGCADGCRLVSVAVQQSALGGYQLDLVLHGLAVDGAEAVPASQFGDGSRWIATDSAKLTTGPDGLTMALDNTSGLAGNSWIKPNDAPYPLPVVSTAALGDNPSIGGLGSAVISVKQVAKVAGLPGLGDWGTFVDLEYADRVADDNGFTRDAQLWLGPAAPANVRELVARHGLIVRQDRTMSGVRAELDGQGPALALWFHLLAAAFAVVLATGGIGMVAAVDRRRRTEDLAALRTQGLRRRVSSRAGLWGYLVVVLAALACGVVAAAVAWALTGADLPVFQGDGHWPLPKVPGALAVLAPLAAVGALFAGVCAAAAAALRRSVR